MKNKSFLTFSNWYSCPTSSNYEDSCEQREEDERLGEWLFAATWTGSTAAGAGSVPHVRCGLCVPNTRPQGFSLRLRCHHAAFTVIMAVYLSHYTFTILPLFWPVCPLHLSHIHRSHSTGKVCTAGQLEITFFPRSKILVHVKCAVGHWGFRFETGGQASVCHEGLILCRFFSIKLRGSIFFSSCAATHSSP